LYYFSYNSGHFLALLLKRQPILQIPKGTRGVYAPKNPQVRTQATGSVNSIFVIIKMKKSKDGKIQTLNSAPIYLEQIKKPNYKPQISADGYKKWFDGLCGLYYTYTFKISGRKNLWRKK
jgi:hypothetical protein